MFALIEQLENRDQCALTAGVLNGSRRIVLNWGAKPKDLDSYLNVPDADPAKRGCIINYKVPFSLTRTILAPYSPSLLPALYPPLCPPSLFSSPFLCVLVFQVHALQQVQCGDLSQCACTEIGAA